MTENFQKNGEVMTTIGGFHPSQISKYPGHIQEIFQICQTIELRLNKESSFMGGDIIYKWSKPRALGLGLAMFCEFHYKDGQKKKIVHDAITIRIVCYQDMPKPKVDLSISKIPVHSIFHGCPDKDMLIFAHFDFDIDPMDMQVPLIPIDTSNFEDFCKKKIKEMAKEKKRELDRQKRTIKSLEKELKSFDFVSHLQ